MLHRPAVTCGPQFGWCCSRALSILGKGRQMMHSLSSHCKAKWHCEVFFWGWFFVLISGVDSWSVLQLCFCCQRWNNCPDFINVDADKCTWNYRRLRPFSCTSFWKHLQVLVDPFSFFGWTTLNHSYCCGFQGFFSSPNTWFVGSGTKKWVDMNMKNMKICKTLLTKGKPCNAFHCCHP